MEWQNQVGDVVVARADKGDLTVEGKQFRRSLPVIMSIYFSPNYISTLLSELKIESLVVIKVADSDACNSPGCFYRLPMEDTRHNGTNTPSKSSSEGLKKYMAEHPKAQIPEHFRELLLR